MGPHRGRARSFRSDIAPGQAEIRAGLSGPLSPPDPARQPAAGVGAQHSHQGHAQIRPAGGRRRSPGLEARNHQPPLRPTAIDQLLGGKPRSRAKVGKVPLHRARTDAYELGGVANGSTSGNERRKRLDLTLCRLRRECAAQVPVPHASRLAVASHSSRPSIGVRLIIRKRRDC